MQEFFDRMRSRYRHVEGLSVKKKRKHLGLIRDAIAAVDGEE